ncbi:protein Shroom2 isoform X2 [Synchiropus splendidus]|uniref:protein Shroom2 isoform X2 n=2 Tax=Synchiropus splendidus TaxID=270530 RepID=UPI00237D674E|nr:protein Shroom2 isoform X2 [Synchiropus splendidus]
MDAEQYGNEAHYNDESVWHLIQRPVDVDQRARDGESCKLVDVFLTGGAPWGFTLRGGLEHREPLLITKVEQGSKAAAVSLQVGDELVNINEIPLSGYRQEAICLVKGSHKALSLVVKRNMKMVDIVAQKMPSENDVHVARSFLTKILRSSMRRNEPVGRPHSWHSTKFNENQPELAKTHSPATTVWHTAHDASSSSTDLSSSWEQTNLRRVSDQFSSHGSMDSLEQVPHPYPAGQLSPAKSNNSIEHLAGGKRDSAYSSFSTSSGTPDYTLSKSNTASTENMYKVSQWEAAGKPNNSRNPVEGVKPDDRLTYFQMPGGCDGPVPDEASSRHSASSRTSFGPVWHVPEKKKTTSPSPPPPPPPARSDSFAATKVHERGHVEGPHSQLPGKNNVSPKNESFYISTDRPINNQFITNKQYSLSSTDVRQGQPPHGNQYYHHRQHSDKGTSQPWASSAQKPHAVGGYFCSMQELPTNGSAHHFGQNQRRSLNASQVTAGLEQNADYSGQNRYYCLSTNQPPTQNLVRKPDDRKSTAGIEMILNAKDRSSLSPQTVSKAKFVLPNHPHPFNANGYSKPQLTETLEQSLPKPPYEDKDALQSPETQYLSCPPSRQPEPQRSFQLQPRESSQDVRNHRQAGNKICPQTTPMLHSLSIDAADQEDRSKGIHSEESVENKQMRRSDRFATTLRSEIQMRKAKLQKSQSASTEEVSEDNQSDWNPSQNTTPTPVDSPFSNTYKDHLKEAQARVLKATSFRRKDLEPVLLESPATDAVAGNYPTTALPRKDITPLPTLSESVTNKSMHAGGLVTRIGGRKRFQAEKKVKSFSEPDKINEVGVQDLQHSKNASSSLDQEKGFEAIGKTVFTVKKHLHGSKESPSETLSQSLASTENIPKVTRERDSNPETCVAYTLPSDQQRLGTFAEYEARWNTQKKTAESRVSGRYRSADNILDSPPEEPSKTACFHERSRSSPSADFYGQNIPVAPTMTEMENREEESLPVKQLYNATGFSDRGPAGSKVKEKPAEFERYCTPPTSPPDIRNRAANHRDAHSLTEPHQPEESAPKKSALKKPSSSRCSETTGQESISQREVFTGVPPNSNPNPAFVPSHYSKGDSEQSKGLVDKGQGAVHQLSASSPPAHSHRTSGLVAMEGQRSPSPHFSPQRLSDKPPLSRPGEDASRMEHSKENSTVKKIPIRIVHSEETADKENCPFLKCSEQSATAGEAPDITRIGSLGAAGLESGFCAFTRQKEESSSAELKSHRDVYMTTVGKSGEDTNGSPSVEEQKREELARDIMGKDKSLADILDQRKMKTTMDLMEGIFPQGEQLLEEAHQRRKVPCKQPGSRPTEDRGKEDNMAAAVTLVTSSTYYSTSAPKAELLIKMKDMQEQNEDDSEEELDNDLANKKQELIDSLSKKLQVLREARESLQEDILDNNALGEEVEGQVQQVCKPNELDKFRMFVGDLDKVVSLLLSLSGRLARVENALNSLEEDATPEERRTLVEKRKLLIRQHEDAKELKENLDRRERVVFDILAGHLQEDSLTDYEHFVKMKSALIIEQRKLEDKIKLGEEQLKCLMDSLPLEQRLSL